jgi:hypothetical protein
MNTYSYLSLDPGENEDNIHIQITFDTEPVVLGPYPEYDVAAK